MIVGSVGMLLGAMMYGDIGKFRHTDTVAGADALLTIRKIQNAVRMTF